MIPDGLSRRRLLIRGLGAAGALLLAGCERLSRTDWFPKILSAGERLNESIHHSLARKAMAQEFTAADAFGLRVNGRAGRGAFGRGTGRFAPRNSCRCHVLKNLLSALTDLRQRMR